MTRRGFVAEIRSEQVLVRLTPTEMAEVQAMADRLGKRPPDVFRAAVTYLALAQDLHDMQEAAHG